MEELIKAGVLTIQLGIMEAKKLVHEDPAAAVEALEQTESLCEETVEILETLAEARDIRAETARIEKQTRWIQTISLVAATAALVANAVMIGCRLW